MNSHEMTISCWIQTQFKFKDALSLTSLRLTILYILIITIEVGLHKCVSEERYDLDRPSPDHTYYGNQCRERQSFERFVDLTLARAAPQVYRLSATRRSPPRNTYCCALTRLLLKPRAQ